jgi:predicted ATPase/transcriptional regulator with XRE-family HTH domain
MENRGRAPGSPDFGMLLRHYRLTAGLSQEVLAERAQMSVNGVSALERGYRRTPQRETLSLLAGALALNDEQREEFEAAAARSVLLGRGASVTVGPWPDSAIASLPLAMTSFVGREVELDEIAALVRERRMVTVTGAGGVGKTQIALHAATALADADHIPVCFVGLAPIASPALVVAAIASTLGVQEMPDHPLLDTLLAYLKNKPLLLILDNCEHVIDEAAIVAGALVAGCPRLRILATSREPLRAAGEHTYRLPSLSLPSPGASRRLGAADAAAYGAMVLFADRARAIDYHFELSDENAPIVGELCRRLDGIPLAIELAAARVNQLPVKLLAEKLDDRFRILTGGVRTALPRQQTMRAAIAWSYDLLAAREQQVFERLSVFAGGCSLGPAAAVCGDDEAAEADVFEVLSSLVNKSLLVLSDFDGSEPRYRLLESSREYAREKLAERGEQEMVAQRHARAYIEVAEQVDAASDTQADSFKLVFPELDNWRAALEWALAARGDVALGQCLVGAWLMVIRAPVEGRRWINLALDLVDERTPANVLARINYASAALAGVLKEGEIELASSEKALALYRRLDDAFWIARSQALLGDALRRLGRTEEAEPILVAALTQLRQLGSRKHLGYALCAMAAICSANGDFSAARTYVAEANAIYKAIGANGTLAYSISDNLAEIELDAGNPELAFRCALDVLPILRTLNDATIVVGTLNTMSACRICLADYDGAEAYARESLVISNELHLSTHVARSLQRLATVAALRAQSAHELRAEPYARATRLFGFVDACLAALGSPRDTLYDRQEYERAMAVLRNAMSSDQLANLMNEGAAMREEQAIDEALVDAI